MAFWRINLRQLYKTNREIQNEFHVEDPTSLVPAEIIADLVEAHWIPHIRNFQVQQLVYFQVRVTRILIPDPFATFIKDINVLGTISGTGDYGFHAWMMRFNTLLLGPKHRGSYFIGGLAPGFQSVQNENMNAAGITQMLDNINQLNAKWCGADPDTTLNLVVAHKDDSTPTRVNDIGFNTLLTTMRSRKIGHGI